MKIFTFDLQKYRYLLISLLCQNLFVSHLSWYLFYYLLAPIFNIFYLTLLACSLLFYLNITYMISQKGLYGVTAGVVTTSILQPFETVKMTLMLPPKDLKLTNNSIRNIGESIRYIIKVNGFKGLYKGLFAAVSKAGLGCYIYFTLLRALQKQNQTHLQDFILSSFARITSTFFTNALSIIETRWEMANFHRYNSIRGAIIDIYRKQGIQGYFSGALTSCLKQGFFGGLYYMFYQQLKDKGLSKFTSGIISGVISTAITHPFELMRARIQTIGIDSKYEIRGGHLLKQIKQLTRTGEWFKGVMPRLFKKPVSNTLTFVIFQIIQEVKRKEKNSY